MLRSLFQEFCHLLYLGLVIFSILFILLALQCLIFIIIFKSSFPGCLQTKSWFNLVGNSSIFVLGSSDIENINLNLNPIRESLHYFEFSEFFLPSHRLMGKASSFTCQFSLCNLFVLFYFYSYYHWQCNTRLFILYLVYV